MKVFQINFGFQGKVLKSKSPATQAQELHNYVKSNFVTINLSSRAFHILGLREFSSNCQYNRYLRICFCCLVENL